MTTLLTDGALCLMALRRPTVPLIAKDSISVHTRSLVCTFLSHTWIEQILLNIRHFKMERAGRMYDCFKWRIGDDGVVERYRSQSRPNISIELHMYFLAPVKLHTIQLRDIFHNHEIKLLLRKPRVRISDLLRLLQRAHSGHNRVAALEERVEDMCGDEATAACVSISQLWMNRWIY